MVKTNEKTDVYNKEKTEFTQKEKFKILLPISNLGQGGDLNIKVESGVQTKPIFYGISSNSANQDYALTGATCSPMCSSWC